MGDNLCPRYTLRLTKCLLDKIDYIAKYEGRSKNKQIERVLVKHIVDFEKEHGKIELDYLE